FFERNAKFRAGRQFASRPASPFVSCKKTRSRKNEGNGLFFSAIKKGTKALLVGLNVIVENNQRLDSG
ncbi:hypothetical protein, partial [Ligilactobacillus ruminis]|uniref:hypothetical protein n=1 Tax=Ligilactobacillus ruminis TaxID=1623 RepID=UPI00325BB787